MKTIELDGETYVLQSDIPAPRPVDGERYVLICTDKRGVFAGFTTETNCDPISLRAGRMVVYWSAAMRGVVGLASMGPDDQCRISEPADMELRGITCVIEISPAAQAKWEAAPWKS
jgi:hypothetical protein